MDLFLNVVPGDISLFDGYTLRIRDTRTCKIDHGGEKGEGHICYLLMLCKDDGWVSLPAGVHVPWKYDGSTMMDECGCWMRYPEGDSISRTAPGALFPCYPDVLSAEHPMYEILHKYHALPAPDRLLVPSSWVGVSLQFRFIHSSRIWQYRYVQLRWSNDLESHHEMLPRLRSLLAPLLHVQHSRCVTKLTLVLDKLLPRDLLELVTSYT